MPTYAEYLKVDELLELQRPLSEGPEHDEMLFIVIHQVYELWFKQVLHELEYLERLLDRNDGVRARHTLKRILTILKVLVAQLDILETMTPLEFLSAFATGSTPAADSSRISFVSSSSRWGGRIPAPWSAIRPAARPGGDWSSDLRPARCGTRSSVISRSTAIAVPRADLERDVTWKVEPSAELRVALVDIYRHRPELADLCERLVDLDEGLMEWRYRHVKMVQRTIGTRRGTGGSSGAEYLPATLNQPLFPDLWAIRTEL